MRDPECQAAAIGWISFSEEVGCAKATLPKTKLRESDRGSTTRPRMHRGHHVLMTRGRTAWRQFAVEMWFDFSMCSMLL